MLAKFAVFCLIAYALVCAGMFFAQDRFLFHPTTVPLEPAAYGLQDFAKVTLKAEDGVALTGWFHDKPGADKAVVLFYGNADALPPYAGLFAGFARAGYSVLGVNYRGYGGSEGAPSEAGFYRDGEAAFKFLAGRVGPENVTVIGRSIGSGVAVDVAARRRVKTLVLLSPYTSITSVASRAFRWLPVSLLLTNRFPSIEKIGRVKAPLLIVHGSADVVIPAEEGRMLFAAANEPKRFESQEGVGHNDLDLARIFQQILEFDDAR